MRTSLTSQRGVEVGGRHPLRLGGPGDGLRLFAQPPGDQLIPVGGVEAFGPGVDLSVAVLLPLGRVDAVGAGEGTAQIAVEISFKTQGHVAELRSRGLFYRAWLLKGATTKTSVFLAHR